MAIYLTIEESPDLDKQLAKIDAFLRRDVLKRAARAGGKVVLKRARQIAPQSIRTGTRKKWSKNTRAARTNVPPFVDSIKLVVRDYDSHVVAVIGAEAGSNLSHLIEDGHALVAWGKVTDVVVTGTPIMERAGDETVAEQTAAFSAVIINSVKSFVASLAVK